MDAAQGQAAAGDSVGEGSLRMVLLSTAVAVCGSFEFDTCVGYSAPAQAGIVSNIGLSNSEHGVFGSALTIGAMIGALTSGRLADTLGRKMTMRLAAIVGILGWLTIYLAFSGNLYQGNASGEVAEEKWRKWRGHGRKKWRSFIVIITALLLGTLVGYVLYSLS